MKPGGIEILLKQLAPEIDLQQFCKQDDEGWSECLKKPFTRDGFTYATDGTILLRMPHVPGSPSWPDIGPDFNPDDLRYQFEPGDRMIADLIIPDEFTYDDFEVEDYSCGMVCDLEMEHKAIIQANGFKLNQRIIFKIKDLPGLKTYFPIPTDKRNQMYFEAGDIQGLAMGMHP